MVYIDTALAVVLCSDFVLTLARCTDLVLVVCGLVTATSVYSFIFAKGFWGLFTSNLAFGIGGGIAVPAVMAMTVIIGRYIYRKKT